MHREIDQFTDQHDLVKKSKRRLYDRFGHYSGVIVDMYYDHFLAANFFKFHSQALEPFTSWVYQTVKDHRQAIPDQASTMLHYMSEGNWLLSYAQIGWS